MRRTFVPIKQGEAICNVIEVGLWRPGQSLAALGAVALAHSNRA